MVLEEEVPVFASGLGSPAPFSDALKANGTTILSLVGNVRAAKQVAESGADYVVAQGAATFGTTFSGTVKETDQGDGSTRVDVVLHTKNALCWVAVPPADPISAATARIPSTSEIESSLRSQ